MERKRALILAIDLGTSGPKTVLVGDDGWMSGPEFEETRLILTPGGGAEQDPADWWRAIVTAVQRLLSKHAELRDDVVAVCCTSQWSGTVAVDDQGDPLMNAIIWLDTRGRDAIAKVTDGWPRIEGYGARKLLTWLRVTGGVPSRSGKDSIAHILYLRQAHPDLYQRTRCFLEPKDWLNLQLTGETCATFDSIALHWVTDNRDIHNVRYDERLVAWTGVDRDKLPPLVAATSVVGTLKPSVAAELGLSAGVRVVAGTPDMQSAAIGSGAIANNESHLYVGTSSWLTCHVPYKKTDLLHNMASLPSPIPGRYFVANEQESAGACLTWLRNGLFFPDDLLQTPTPDGDVWPVFDRMVEQVPAGCDGLLFTPWLYGERTPVEDHSLRSSFVHMSLSTRREHLVRAVYEGVAFNTRWLLQHLESFIGTRADPIRFIGGGANSAVWTQIFADVLDRTILRVDQPALANLRGAAVLGFVALGMLDTNDVAAWVGVRETVTPNPKVRGLYDEHFEAFLSMYKRNRTLHRKLQTAVGRREVP